jgi:hypothetical protein
MPENKKNECIKSSHGVENYAREDGSDSQDIDGI